MSDALTSAASGPPAAIKSDTAVDIGKLSGSQKAAIIVRMILSQGGNMDLSGLSADAQMRLASDYAGMVRVNSPTMQAIVDELEAGLARNDLAFPDAPSEALSQIGTVLSPDIGPSLHEHFGLTERPDPWNDLDRMAVADIALKLADQNPQIGAVILSKLTPDRAAEVLENLPDLVAVQMTLAIAQTANTGFQSVKQMGQGLAQRSEASKSPPAFAKDPVARTAAILNGAKARQRDALLATLTERDPDFARDVRKAIFTFGDIPVRLKAEDVPKITRDIPQDALITALVFGGDAHADVTAFILDNMSQRMADQLREEMSEQGEIHETAGEAATAQVSSVIRALVDRGDLTLIEVDAETSAGQAA